MQSIRMIFRALTLVLALIAPQLAQAAFPLEQGRITVDDYVAGLQNGDTDLLASAFSDELRRQHAALLGNAQYSQTLQTIYAGASFVIDSIVEDSDAQASARVSVHRGGGAPQVIRLTLGVRPDGQGCQIEQIHQ